MNPDISLDLGGAEALLTVMLNYGSRLFDQDSYAQSIKNAVRARIRQSMTDCQHVFIPHATPLPLLQVYQRQRVGSSEEPSVDDFDIQELQSSTKSFILFALPGRGKTVSLQFLYWRIAQAGKRLPLLYLLKEADTLSELTTLLNAILNDRRNLIVKGEIALLLDGYDEIPTSERAELSLLLKRLIGYPGVTVMMTCRMFYEVANFPAQKYYLREFTERDALAFLEVALRHQGSKAPAHLLVEGMKERGFDDILMNPLFLSLLTLIQKRSRLVVPRSPVRLLEEVVNYLQYEWDNKRGVERQCLLQGLDGRELMWFLRSVAHKFHDIRGHKIIALKAITDVMERKQLEGVDADEILDELSRWFGMLIPTDTSKTEWTFVHRSVHEFLAAQYMVSNNLFSPNSARRNWRRAHFAACYVDDATDYICQALEFTDDLEMFVECCTNEVLFRPANIALALMKFYDRTRQAITFRHDPRNATVFVRLEQDYLRFVQSPFLKNLIGMASKQTSYPTGRFVCLALALSELRQRNIPTETLDIPLLGHYRWTIERAGIPGRIAEFTSIEAARKPN